MSIELDAIGASSRTNTGHGLLIEGTYWDDRIWGVDMLHPDRPGETWLGVLLMARRADLRGARALKKRGMAV